MLKYLRTGLQFFSKQQGLRSLLIGGGSVATVGALGKPATDYMANLNAAANSKMNIALGIGVLLLASNAYFAYHYYRLLSASNEEQPPQTEEPPTQSLT